MAILTGPLKQGKTRCVLDKDEVAAGTVSKHFEIDSDSVLVTACVESISGTLDIKVYTSDGAGELEVISFPSLTATSTELLIKKAAVAMSSIRVEATYSAACKFTIYARAIGTGETSVRIAGSDAGKASATTAGTTVGVLIGASLDDREGMVIRNYTNGVTLYIGFSIAETTLATGYPLGPQEALGLDVAGGVTVYGITDTGVADVRILESGG